MNKANLPNPNAVVIGSAESNVALCTLWAQKELIAGRLDKDSFFICGNLYSLEGINQLIRTIYLNPWLRIIAICGEDLSRSGETLLKLFQNGVDEDNGIIGTNFKVDKNIAKEYIDLLRKNVTITDMRRKSTEELRQKVNELNAKRLEPFTEPKEFPKTEFGVDFIPSEVAGYSLRGKSIGETWLSFLDLVMKLGVEKKSEYQMKQKEMLNVMAVIEGGDNRIEEWLPFTKEDLERYVPTIVSNKKPDKVSYSYGERLFENIEEIGANQVDFAINYLKKTPYSRRALAFTWRLGDANKEQPPCLTQVVWNIQFNKLWQTAIFRSHDIYAAWPMNLFALKKLQEDVASKIGIESGPLACLSVSAHIYENDWKEANRILEKHKRPDYKFYADPRGSFVIRIEGDELVVDFYTQDGSKTQYSFRGTDVIKLYKEISQSHFIVRLDHAANLGMELYKASQALKKGLKYIQDEELEDDEK